MSWLRDWQLRWRVICFFGLSVNLGSGILPQKRQRPPGRRCCSCSEALSNTYLQRMKILESFLPRFCLRPARCHFYCFPWQTLFLARVSGLAGSCFSFNSLHWHRPSCCLERPSSPQLSFVYSTAHTGR